MVVGPSRCSRCDDVAAVLSPELLLAKVFSDVAEAVIRASTTSLLLKAAVSAEGVTWQSKMLGTDLPMGEDKERFPCGRASATESAEFRVLPATL